MTTSSTTSVHKLYFDNVSSWTNDCEEDFTKVCFLTIENISCCIKYYFKGKHKNDLRFEIPNEREYSWKIFHDDKCVMSEQNERNNVKIEFKKDLICNYIGFRFELTHHYDTDQTISILQKRKFIDQQAVNLTNDICHNFTIFVKHDEVTHTLHTNTLLLATISPVLKEMLDTNMKESRNASMTITNFKVETVKTFLAFPYMNELTSKQLTLELFEMAIYYQYEFLKIKCEQTYIRYSEGLFDNMIDENDDDDDREEIIDKIFFDVVQFAMLHDLRRLKAHVLKNWGYNYGPCCISY